MEPLLEGEAVFFVFGHHDWRMAKPATVRSIKRVIGTMDIIDPDPNFHDMTVNVVTRLVKRRSVEWGWAFRSEAERAEHIEAEQRRAAEEDAQRQERWREDRQWHKCRNELPHRRPDGISLDRLREIAALLSFQIDDRSA